MTTVSAPTTVYPTDAPLLARVMKVYRPDCTYLKAAEVTTDASGLTVARCELSIPAPFYIDDTGHFNAVEFNLCYNQMMYYAVAKSVRENLMVPFADWTMEDFWERQLPDFLIVDFHSSFGKGVRAQRFYGELAFREVKTSAGGRNWPAMIVAETAVRYWDDEGGRCHGEVRLVVTRPPGQARAAAGSRDAQGEEGGRAGH